MEGLYNEIGAMNLEKIDELIKRRKYDEALSICLASYQASASYEYELNRRMAKIYYLQSNHADAYLHRSRILASGLADLQDYYLAGDSAIAIGKYDEAEAIFKKLLKLGEEKNEDWFDSAALFFLSFSQMQLKKFEEATSSLDAAVMKDSTLALPIPGTNETLSHEDLRMKIIERSKKGPKKTIYF